MVCRSEVVSPVTTLIENRERISIESLSARIRGSLGCPGEKGGLVYEFPNRTRQ
jgi:hypothetical protein